MAALLNGVGAGMIVAGCGGGVNGAADEIAGEYDLTLAQVYAALAYYHEHRATIDAAIRESTEWVVALQRARPSKPGRNS